MSVLEWNFLYLYLEVLLFGELNGDQISSSIADQQGQIFTNDAILRILGSINEFQHFDWLRKVMLDNQHV